MLPDPRIPADAGLFLGFQGRDHIDGPVFAGDHQADRQRDAEGEQDADNPGGRAEGEFQLILGSQRGEQVLQDAHAGRDP